MAKLKHSFKDFDELSIYLKSELKKKYLTVYVDSLFLDRRKLSEIIFLAVKEAKIRKTTDQHYNSVDNIEKHIEYRSERGYRYKRNGDRNDPYIQLVGYENPKDSQRAKKETIINQQSNENGYLPAKSDCEKVISNLTDSVLENEIDLEELLVELEKDLTEKGKTLKSNWKIITEENLKLWFK